MDAAELAFSGIARQAALIRDGEVSSRELVEVYLERIARLDRQLNSFRIVLAERALAEADQADGRRGAGGERPLLGVPIAIKDEFDVAGELNTCGTGAYGKPAERDSEVVRRLRAAGAIPIGITTVPELTIWPFTETATWGVTRNPWNVDRTPGGSSGGSAAAVAAGLVGAAVGSDGLGSIRIPSACCGLFGLKPQRGRVSYAPLSEHWHGLSVVGGLTRSVADGALFLDAVAGRAEGDAVSPPPPERPFAKAAAQSPGKLRVAVSFAVPPGVVAKVHDEVRAGLAETVEVLRSLGHDVVERNVDYGLATVNMVGRYLRGIHDDARAMPHPQRLERRTQGMARLGRLISPALLRRARAAEATDAARAGTLFADHDVVLTPVLTRAPLEVGAFEGRGALWSFNRAASFTPFTGAWNHTGQPAASVPAGWDSRGLPRAVQLVGRPNDEATLLSLAAQLEAERPWAQQRPPVS